MTKSEILTALLHALRLADAWKSPVNSPECEAEGLYAMYLIDRGKEEKMLLKEEMQNVFYYQQQHNMFTDFIFPTNNPIIDEIQLNKLLFCHRKLLYVQYRLNDKDVVNDKEETDHESTNGKFRVRIQE